MRRLVFLSLLVLLALNAFGHAGEVHKYLGTVTAVHDDGSFTLKKTDGTAVEVAVSAKTVYVFANGTAAQKSDLAEGKRAVVTISKDGKTASEVKFANPKG